MGEGRLFCWLLLFRAANALSLQTSFAPDEFWQSLEVAHKIVFGCVRRTRPRCCRASDAVPDAALIL